MLILYVHARIHVGTTCVAGGHVWMGVHKGGRGREGEKSEERRTVDRYSNEPFVPARSLAQHADIHRDNDDNDDNGDNDEYDERGVPSLFPPSTPSRGWYNGQVARLLSSILALFFRVSLRAFGWPPLDRKSSSIVRFFRKMAVPVLFGSKGDYTWRGDFFWERERGYDRSRNFSTESGAEFWSFWDEYRSGFGWRRRN